MSFTILDIIIFAILIASSTLGMYRGFTKVVVGSVAFILSIFTAFYLYPHTKDFLNKYVTNELALTILSSTISYLTSLTFFSFLNFKFCEIIKSICEGALDKFLGLFAGFVRGCIICMILYTTIIVISSKSYSGAISAEDMYENAIDFNHPKWLTNSITFNILDETTRNIVDILPERSLQSIKLPERKAPKNNSNFNKGDVEETSDMGELNEELDDI